MLDVRDAISSVLDERTLAAGLTADRDHRVGNVDLRPSSPAGRAMMLLAACACGDA